MTLKEQVAYIENICLSHKMIKQFVFCEAWEVLALIKPGIKYPLAMLNPSPGELLANTVNRGYVLTIMEQPNKQINADNTLQIQSDCEGYIQDILNKIVFDDEELMIINQPSIEIFKENFGDWCAGAMASLVVETDNTGSCDLPFNE